MRIKVGNVLNKLKEIEMEMGIDPASEFHLDLKFERTELNPDELAALNQTGIIKSFEDIEGLIPGGPLEYKGKKIIVHIMDIRAYGEHYTLPKFHVMFCKTLQGQKANNKLESRYVFTRRLDGKFSIRKSGVEAEERLDVCMNCLDALDYAGYRSLSSKERKLAVKTFDASIYFAQGYVNNSPTPLYLDVNAPVSEYQADWSRTSSKMKEMAGYICQNKSCRRNLKNYELRRFLHTHHIDSNPSNNVPENLKVLCVECHSLEPGHSHMKNNRDYKEFMRLKGMGQIN